MDCLNTASNTWEIPMSDGSKIEWTDATWNVVIGCDKVSPGCTRCYAIRTVVTGAWLPSAKTYCTR